MNSSHTSIETGSTSQHLNNTARLSNEKTLLVKEIGRLRVQLHQAQWMDSSQQRCDFLRGEIAELKCQIESLAKQVGPV